MQCLALASALAASAAGGASVCLGSQVGGPGCSKYLLPCRRAPGQSASCGVLLIENLCMHLLETCPGASPKENCFLF